jgi:hypothetical protein
MGVGPVTSERMSQQSPDDGLIKPEAGVEPAGVVPQILRLRVSAMLMR